VTVTFYSGSKLLVGQAELDHLARCREAWQLGVGALTDPTATLRLGRAAKELAELAGLEDPLAAIDRAYWALKPYPMPKLPPEQENTMWDFFFRLVITVQDGDSKEHQWIWLNQLQILVAGTGLHTEWWLQRARAYAPLGLTVGTRV